MIGKILAGHNIQNELINITLFIFQSNSGIY